jgi:cytochrome c peroxidase
MKQIFLALFIASFLLSLQFFLPQKKFETYSDEDLRQKALRHGMKSNPKSFKELQNLYPKTNLSKKSIVLGEKLFFDKNLSKNRDFSCNSCHTLKTKENSLINILTKQKHQTTTSNCKACHTMDNSGTDRLTSSQSYKEHPYKLNVQTVLNVGVAKYFTWGGEIKTLQEHISNSIISPHKLNLSKKEAQKDLI